MDAASIFIALISIVFAVASVVVRMSGEEIYFDKEYKYAIRRANEELPAEALSPIEAVITEVVEYELQTLRGNIEETVEQQVDSDVHPTTGKDSPVADVLNEYDSTDISLTDAVDDDGISSFSSVDTPEDIPEVIQSEIAEPIDALEELHDIVEQQPTVQRRESRLLLGSIVFGIIALVVTIVRFFMWPQVSLLWPGSASLLALLSLVAGIYHQDRHQRLEDRFNEIVRENNLRTGDETLSQETQSDSSSASRETESESESQKRDPQRARGQ